MKQRNNMCDDSSGSLHIMEQYLTKSDIDSVSTTAPQRACNFPQLPVYVHTHPSIPKENFLRKIPSSVYKNFTIERTPTLVRESTVLCNTKPQTLIPDSAAPDSVRRCLFTSEDCEIENTAAKVTTWLAGQQTMYDSDEQDKMTEFSTPEVEKFGFELPKWLKGKSAPKLVSQHRRASGCPLSAQERMDIARDNHTKVRQWLQDNDIKRKVGHGHIPSENQAIQSSVDDCEFRDKAYKILESLNAVSRYPVKKYIDELKKKEELAIQMTRVYRDKWEEEIAERQNDAIVAKKHELNIRTFWRKNIAEQCTRGGKMLNLSLSKKV